LSVGGLRLIGRLRVRRCGLVVAFEENFARRRCGRWILRAGSGGEREEESEFEEVRQGVLRGFVTGEIRGFFAYGSE